MEELADRFTEERIFTFLDEAYQSEKDWLKCPPLDFSKMDPKHIIVFGGATVRVERALAWLKSRNIKYPFE